MHFYLVVLLTALLTAGTDGAVLSVSSSSGDEPIVRVVQLGMALNLPCTKSGDEEILDFFTWSRNGVLLPDRYSRFLQSRFIIQSDYSLQIDRVAEDDDGNYTCHVLSHPPRILNYIVHVRVPAAIDGRLEETVHQVREGADLELFCLASGRPVPSVSWVREGRVLSAEESVIDVNQSVSTLHRIVKARRSDAGRYVCEATNGVDAPARAIFIVEVLHPPEIVVEHNWVHTGLGSIMTELACTVFSQPPAQVTWLRSEGNYSPEDRQLVAFSPRIEKLVVLTIGLKHVLRFHSVRDSDLGTYVCRAENVLGQAEASIEMSGKPTVARLYVLPRSDNHIDSTFEQQKGQQSCYHLAWEAMSRSPIYEYKLWLKPSGYPKSNWTSIIVPSNSSALTIDAGSQHKSAYDLCDLTRNVVYDVTVQSRNRYGWSDESNALLLSGEQETVSSPAHDDPPPELTSAAATTAVVMMTTTTVSSTTTVPTTTTASVTTTPATTPATTTAVLTTTSETTVKGTLPESTIANGETEHLETTTVSEVVEVEKVEEEDDKEEEDEEKEEQAVTTSTASTSHSALTSQQSEESPHETTTESTAGTVTDAQTSEAPGSSEDDSGDSPSPVVAPDNAIIISSSALSKLTSERRWTVLLSTLCLLVTLSFRNIA